MNGVNQYISQYRGKYIVYKTRQNRPIPLRMRIWIPSELLGQKKYANRPVT